MNQEAKEKAFAYLESGLCVLPASAKKKHPEYSWKRFQARRPGKGELEELLGRRPQDDALAVVTGKVSGPAGLALVVIDFDQKGECFPLWLNAIESTLPRLVDRFVITRTQHGGFHVVYLAPEGVVQGSEKLASRPGESDKPVVLVETRAQGGLVIVPPSPGYTYHQGDLVQLPALTEDEHRLLLAAARQYHVFGDDGGPGGDSGPEKGLAPVEPGPPAPAGEGLSPGEDFNRRGDLRPFLEASGWEVVGRQGENLLLRRPGKKKGGHSATFDGETFYNHSTNAQPFQAGQGYQKFAFVALAGYGGDYSRAAGELRRLGYGDDEELPEVTPETLPEAPAGEVGEAEPEEDDPRDPGPLPVELLRVPGFISEVMDYCLETAPYPNPAMAFAGALALQAFLAGRKVRDPGDNRTNLYLLGLAHSASGKDWPRKLNQRIAHQVGLGDGIQEQFASGEGIQDALFTRPCRLFQTDEIDGLLQSIHHARDARHEHIMGTLLTMYSASNSVYTMRARANLENAGIIDQPHLVLFGTAIPNHYYEALSERMLTNGFFARMIVLESGKRGKGQDPKIIEVPERILATAKGWADRVPGEAGLAEIHPRPRTVDYTLEAKSLQEEMRAQVEVEYGVAENASDPVGTAVWGRADELVRKLSLIHAVSVAPQEPVITAEAVRWAAALVLHQSRRMLYMARVHVADNPFHAACLKLLGKLRKAPGQQLAHQTLLKRMKVDARSFRDLVVTLVQRGEVLVEKKETQTRPGVYYRLRGAR